MYDIYYYFSGTIERLWTNRNIKNNQSFFAYF